MPEWYPFKNLGRLLSQTRKEGLDKKKFPYHYLFELQDKLIEHKWEDVVGWMNSQSKMIEYAGDIYRAMTHNQVDGGYAGEKQEKLMRAIQEDYWFTRQDYTEERERLKAPTYKEKAAKFKRDLATLVEATEKATMDKPRKDVMLWSLRLISALVKWYESGMYVPKPRRELDMLIEKMDHYFERRT